MDVGGGAVYVEDSGADGFEIGDTGGSEKRAGEDGDGDVDVLDREQRKICCL